MIDYIARIQSVAEKQKKSSNKESYRRKFEAISPEYKHHLSGCFVLVDGNKIETSICGQDIIVTRKIDGEMRTVYFDGQQCFMYTTGGKEETGFPCLTQMAEKLKSKGYSACAFAAELNFVSPKQKDVPVRTRVTEVIHAIATPGLHERLALYPFDILFLDDQRWAPLHYKETYAKLEEIFGKYDLLQLVTPVQMEKADSPKQVQEIYNKWVKEEKAEGLVVHSEQPIIWKIKPQHTVDAVAVGYTTTAGELRDLLFAVIDENGLYRIFCHGGNGLTNETKRILISQFENIKVESNCHNSDSTGAVFQMIEPKYVFEISAIDFASENCLHQCYKNQKLSFAEGKWTLEQITPGVTTYSMKILNLREDKKPIFQDCRETQLSDICPFTTSESANSQPVFVKKETLADSEILFRTVYKKTTGSSIYVKKFVLLKTNKQSTGRFPSYLLHFSSLSSRSTSVINKRVFISEDKNQLYRMMHELIEKEIKTGWVNVK